MISVKRYPPDPPDPSLPATPHSPSLADTYCSLPRQTRPRTRLCDYISDISGYISFRSCIGTQTAGKLFIISIVRLQLQTSPSPRRRPWSCYSRQPPRHSCPCSRSIHHRRSPAVSTDFPRCPSQSRAVDTRGLSRASVGSLDSK